MTSGLSLMNNPIAVITFSRGYMDQSWELNLMHITEQIGLMILQLHSTYSKSS